MDVTSRARNGHHGVIEQPRRVGNSVDDVPGAVAVHGVDGVVHEADGDAAWLVLAVNEQPPRPVVRRRRDQEAVPAPPDGAVSCC